MLVKTVMLNTINDVTEFVSIAASKDFKISLKTDKLVVDAKSIMAVFSLDLTKPFTLEADCKPICEFSRQIQKFICDKK